jgi:hypothetical protein
LVKKLLEVDVRYPGLAAAMYSLRPRHRLFAAEPRGQKPNYARKTSGRNLPAAPALCLLTEAIMLLSLFGSCPAGRDFAPPFIESPPRDDHLKLR